MGLDYGSAHLQCNRYAVGLGDLQQRPLPTNLHNVPCRTVWSDTRTTEMLGELRKSKGPLAVDAAHVGFHAQLSHPIVSCWSLPLLRTLEVLWPPPLAILFRIKDPVDRRQRGGRKGRSGKVWNGGLLASLGKPCAVASASAANAATHDRCVGALEPAQGSDSCDGRDECPPHGPSKAGHVQGGSA